MTLKTKRLINAAVWLTLAIACSVTVCIVWYNQGCGVTSLIAAIIWYSLPAVAWWFVVDQALKGK